MPNFEMYLEIGSQGHKNKLSSKIKKIKKSALLCQEPVSMLSAKGIFPKKRTAPYPHPATRAALTPTLDAHTHPKPTAARAPPTLDAVRRHRQPNPSPSADTAPAPAPGPLLPCPARRRHLNTAFWWRRLSGRRRLHHVPGVQVFVGSSSVFVGSLALRRRRGRTRYAHPSPLKPTTQTLAMALRAQSMSMAIKCSLCVADILILNVEGLL